MPELPCRYPGCGHKAIHNQALGEHRQCHKDSKKRWICPSEGCTTWRHLSKATSFETLLKHYEREHQNQNVIDTISTIPCAYPGCDKKASGGQALGRHVEECHKDRRGHWICPVEGCKTWVHPSKSKRVKIDVLLRHYAREHSKETFLCPIDHCDESFSSDRDRKRHMNTHVIPSCPLCPNSFYGMRNLVDHMKTDHPYQHQTEVFDIEPFYMRELLPRFSFRSLDHERRLSDTVLGKQIGPDDGRYDSEDNVDVDDDTNIHDQYTPSLKQAIQERNRKFLKYASTPVEGFKAAPMTLPDGGRLCPGSADGPCSWDVEISSSTAFYSLIAKGPVGFYSRCVLCYRKKELIEDILRKKKVNANGERLCSASFACKNVVRPGYFKCEGCYEHTRALAHLAALTRLITNKTRSGAGRDIETPDQMQHLLSTQQLQTRGATQWVMKAAYEQQKLGTGVYYVDFEFTSSFPMEICLRDTDGNVVVDTLIDHECSIAELYDSYDFNNMELQTMLRLYGPYSQARTPGKTIKEIVTLIIEAGVT